MADEEKCKNVRSRKRIDQSRGLTTSNAVIEFIRRTCACVHCKEWRRGSKNGSHP